MHAFPAYYLLSTLHLLAAYASIIAIMMLGAYSERYDTSVRWATLKPEVGKSGVSGADPLPG